MKKMLSSLMILAVLMAGQVWAATGTQPVQLTLQNAVGQTASGTPMPVLGLASVGVQVTISNTATVTFKVSLDNGTTYNAVLCTLIGSTTTSTTASATNAYQCPVAGATHFLAPVTGFTSGTVTVFANAIEPGGSASGGGGGSGYAGQQDKTAFTEGTTLESVIGGCFNATRGGSVTEDNVACARISNQGDLHVVPYDSAGNDLTNASVQGIKIVPNAAFQQTNIVPQSGGQLTDGGTVLNLAPATNGDNAVVAAVAAKVTRLYGAVVCNLHASTNIQVIWRSGTTPVSATYPIAASTCLVQALRADSWAITGTNTALNLNVNAAVNVSVQYWSTTN